MKTLQHFIVWIALLACSAALSQSETSETSSNPDTKTEISDENLALFVGTYFLAEGDFELKIVREENDAMFIVSPFSKDPLTVKNETTLHEPTRGVDLELIENDSTALIFTQNGYLTKIKRVSK
ncbi:MAG: hypothetical protein AAFP76_07280 [Bacteroidota bacterium]